MIAGSDGSSPADLQSLIQAAIPLFKYGFPEGDAERQRAESTLEELLTRFDEVAALPHAERFPALKLIVYYAHESFISGKGGKTFANDVIERAFDAVYSTDEKDLSFTEKMKFLDERIALYTRNPPLSSSERQNVTIENQRFVRNLRNLGGLKSRYEAVKFIETNYELFKPFLEAAGLLKTHNIWPDSGYYIELRKEAKKYDMLNAKPGEARISTDFHVPHNLILAAVGVVALVGGAYLYATVYNVTNDQSSQTPQKDEQQELPAQVHPKQALTTKYSFEQALDAYLSTHPVFEIKSGEEKRLRTLVEQCAIGLHQYMNDNSITLDVSNDNATKIGCYQFLHQELMEQGYKIREDKIRNANGKSLKNNPFKISY